MTLRWYLARNAKKYGPYSTDQLRQFAASGHLVTTDMLLQEGAQKWVVASSVSGLFVSTAIAAQPAPPPIPPPQAPPHPPATESAFRDLEAASLSRRQPTDELKWYNFRGLMILGALLFIGGIIGTVHFLVMDTTVPVPAVQIFGERLGGGRVHNIGLMQERQNGIIVSIAVAALGFTLMILARRKPKST